MADGIVEVNCIKNASECEYYLSRGYVQLSNRKLIDSTVLVDRFTGDVCLEAYGKHDVIRPIAQFAVSLTANERDEPLQYLQTQYQETTFWGQHRDVLFILVGLLIAISNMHLFIKAIRIVEGHKFSHIAMATLSGTGFLFCGVELAVTTFVFSILDVVVDKKDSPELHQVLKTIVETRRRLVAAITISCLVFIAIDRFLHFRNIHGVSMQKKKLQSKKLAKIFFAFTLFAILDCFTMAFFENWWRANKKEWSHDPSLSGPIGFVGYKIFDNNQTSLNPLRTLDLFDAMLPVTYLATIIICFSVYSLIGFQIFQMLKRQTDQTDNNLSLVIQKRLKKSLRTVGLNLGTVMLFAACWFPYTIIGRLSELTTNCSRTYFNVILFWNEPDSFGWNSVVSSYIHYGEFFYLFAALNSMLLIIGHKKYRVVCCCCRKEESYPISRGGIDLDQDVIEMEPFWAEGK